jgi:hypothetical protein
MFALQQQVRSYAKAAGKGGKSAKPAVAAAAPAKEADPLAQPVFRLKRVPQVNKGDPVAQLTGPQVSNGPLKNATCHFHLYLAVDVVEDTGHMLLLCHAVVFQRSGTAVQVVAVVSSTPCSWLNAAMAV